MFILFFLISQFHPKNPLLPMLIEAIEVVARRPQKAALHLEIAEKRQMPISLQANLRDTGRVVCKCLFKCFFFV